MHDALVTNLLPKYTQHARLQFGNEWDDVAASCRKHT